MHYIHTLRQTIKSIRLYRRENDQRSAKGKPHHVITPKHGILRPKLLCYNLISFHVSGICITFEHDKYYVNVTRITLEH